MKINKEYSNVYSEMYQELEAFLITLDYFVDDADDGSVEVDIESYTVEVSEHMIEDPLITFRWTCNDFIEEYGIKLDWHDLINHYMEESELFEFCEILSNYTRRLEKALLTHGISDQFTLEEYIEIRNLCDIAWGKHFYIKHCNILLKEAESECNTN